MKVLVTGAAGLVGSHLARHLLYSGFTVSALVNPETDIEALEGLPIERVSGDTLDPESVLNALKGTQAVFHCATSSDHWPARGERVSAMNYKGTLNLLVAMNRAGVESIVHLGSATSFGPGTIDEPGTEDSPYAGERFRLACIDSMRRAQELVERFNREGRVKAVIVNPTCVLGPYDTLPGPGRALLQYAGFNRGRYPSGGVNIIGAGDVARGILGALGRGSPGRSYILGGQNIDYRQLFSKVAVALDLRAPDRQVPDGLLMAKGIVGSLYGKLTGRRPALTAGLARLLITRMYYSSDRAVGELGLSRSPVDTVIEEACRWFMDNREQDLTRHF